MKALLVEILIEELPALPLLKELANIPLKWQKSLEKYKLKSDFDFYYTPRRLVFHHKSFKLRQDDFKIEFFGPPKQLAYTAGELNIAGQSFLKKAGCKESELCFKTKKNKEVLYFLKKQKGLKANLLLENIIKDFLKSLDFGKKMRWDDGDYDFIRAIRSLVCVLGDELIPCFLYGVNASKSTYLHRQLGYDKKAFKDITGYFKLLEEGFVVLDQNKRLENLKNELTHYNYIKDDELLAELVAITEYPSVLKGNFDKDFLRLPAEVIITTMKEHQRYFALVDKNTLSNAFLVVSNAACKDFSKVIKGNERVLKARLSDALFFYENDLKSMLNNKALENMLFLDGLGSLKDKVERERKIALLLAKSYDFSNTKDLDTAVKYSKSDLSSQMVYEFPKLQGIMGYYYALNMGLNTEIALSLKEQYSSPSNRLSSLLCLAYRIDTLMGLFSLGKKPTGSKDPFALRRFAKAVLQIIIKERQSFNLKAFLQSIKPLYKDFDINILIDFIYERLFSLYELNPSFIKAVLKSDNHDILHIHKSILALQRLCLDEQRDLSVFKRLANIVSINKNKINKGLFKDESELALYKAFTSLNPVKDEEERLRALFDLREKIELFFARVLINDENEALRLNRHALIYAIYKEFLKIADLKELSL